MTTTSRIDAETATTAAVKPRALALELVKACNLRCGYCYYAQRDDAYDPKKIMSPAVAKRSVDLLIEDGPAGQPLHLHFFGGEPLLNFGLLSETVRYARERGQAAGKTFTFEVTTNGTRFTPEIIRFLNEHSIHVAVSFDGPPDVQDVARPAFGGSSYAAAVGGIRALIESRRGTPLAAKIHASVVVTRAELDVVRISRHLEELGFPKIVLTIATDLTGQSYGVRETDLPILLDHYDRLAADAQAKLRSGLAVPTTWYPRLLTRIQSSERKAAYCGGGRDYLGVAADGKVALCYRFFEAKDYAMGDVFTGIDRSVTRRLEALRPDKRTVCSECWALAYCGGGCHHDNAFAGGGLGDPNPITCEIFRHSMSRALEMWGRLARDGAGSVRPSLSSGDGMSASKKSYRSGDRPKKRGGCHVREIGDERVVYDPATHQVGVLNATAVFIFERCDGARTVDDLLGELAGRFDAPREVLEKDLGAMLGLLSAKNFIE